MTTDRLLTKIRCEFQDHPGIVVTLPQAQNRWALDKRQCIQVFETLLAEGFLQRVGDVYIWRDAPVPQFRVQTTDRRIPLIR